MTTIPFPRSISGPASAPVSSPPTRPSVNPLSNSSRIRSPSAASNTASSWLNTLTGNLTDGLSWIESQGGNVVNQAATNGVTLSGVGETIRGGLAGKGRALSGFGLSGITGLVSGSGASVEHGLNAGLGVRTLSESGLAGPSQLQRGASSSSAGSVVSDTPGVDLSNLPQPRSGSRPNSLLGGLNRPASAQPSLGSSPTQPAFASSASSTPRKPSLSSSVSSPPGTTGLSQSNRKVETGRKPPAPANLSRLTSQPASIASAGLLIASHTSPGTASGRLNAHRSSLSGANVPNASIGISTSASSSTSSLNANPRNASAMPAFPASSSTPMLSSSLAPSTSPNHRANSYGPFSLGSTIGRSSSQRSHLSTHSDSYIPGSSSSRTAEPSASTSTAAVTGPRQRERTQTPYKPGFQPQGVRSSRMEDFERGRKEAGAERGKEEGRLGRRWGKLIDLHFNPNSTALSSSPSPAESPPPPALTRSPSLASTLADKRRSLLPNRDSIASRFDNIKAMDVWRGIRSVSGVGADAVDDEKKRDAERGIVKWEEDWEVKRCRICQSLFSISNRKHHCRICGRILCSLPPTADSILALATQNPSVMAAASLAVDLDSSAAPFFNSNTGLPLGIRREKCSFLLVADWRTGKGEIVEDGFVGWMQTDVGADGSKTGKKKGRRRKGEEGDGAEPESPSKRQGKPMLADEIQVKGVRACRDCWAVVSRKQKMTDMSRISGFSRLYDVLKEVEREIQEILPDFQEAMLAMNPEASDLPIIVSPDTVAMYKQLVMLFTQYDTLTKRVRAQPCEPGTNQERLQSAIARASSAFVAKEAIILQALPRLQKQRHKRAKSSLAASVISADSTPQASDVGSLLAGGLASRLSLEDEMAMTLQPLLEQEAQIEEYIREANAQRKFDDAQTLQVSLNEIRAEVARITTSS